MDSILAQFFREHNQHAAWWYKMKIKPELPLESTNNVLLPPDEAPGEHCLSKFLGITMEELWNVLIACKLAKETKGNRGPMLDKNKISNFITGNALTNILELIMKDSEHILRIGVYSEKSSSSDYKPKDQWKSKTKPRRLVKMVYESALFRTPKTVIHESKIIPARHMHGTTRRLQNCIIFHLRWQHSRQHEPLL
jgi:hypothetical protein